MTGKPWYLSKTLWVAILTAVVGVLEATQDFIPPEYVGAVLFVVGALNFAIRWLTDQPIRFRSK